MKSKTINLDTLRSLHALGLNDAEIGRRLGISRSYTANRRRALGLKANTNNECGRKYRTSTISREKIRTLFHEGKSDLEIAGIIGCSHHTASAIRRQLRLIIRNYRHKQPEDCSDNSVTINYLAAIQPFRDFKERHPDIAEAVFAAYNRELEKTENGWRDRQ